ncbi:MAG: hypothetical protein GWN01_02130 [Nitrosopumilaceae archaeon]|nr:hypothetical protein [Nitrosopumilaceae archaeon]NIT99772.1 hypothetical protein [Nitrosopumilaceae archaeon]NIU88634.1 hypothetical protein [Nitrosopumilaceae archaeon]NIV64908.1 hypothetical protein [Nitrosopumilaceae archaeon]NIX60375.1 hypothetical protein [Nitrosopumilaceae archaeon]
MPKQYEDNSPTSTEVRDIVSREVRPLLDKLDVVIHRLEKYHEHDINFQRNLLLLLSRLLANQEISMEAFDKLDSFLQEEFFWNKDST